MLDITQASLILAGASVLVGIAVLVAGLAFSRLVPLGGAPGAAEAPPLDPARRRRRSVAYRTGAAVLLGLAVLTAVEYGIAMAIHSNVLPYLALIALIKAGLIVQYFMHVTQLWRREGGHA